MNTVTIINISSIFKATALASSLLLLSACQGNQKPQITVPNYSSQQQTQASEQLTQLLDSFQTWQLDSSPISQSYRGKKTKYDRY
jgi:Tfp pilus assembly protein PilP